ncbi:MAG: hypothetical protein M3Z15_05590, partial [Pseudomonadota bacterium]|nr:hypothetical protein [Pseudomonadota bacterium]
MSGTLVRPASPFFEGAIDRVNARRLAAAATAAVVMHVVLLAARPGALASSYVAPSAPRVMAVRMLPVPAVVTPLPVAAEVVAARTSPEFATPIADRVSAEAARSPTTVEQPETKRATTAATDNASIRADDVAPGSAAAAVEPKAAEMPLAAAPDYAFGVRLD